MTRGQSTGLWVYIVAVALTGAAVHGLAVMPLAEGRDIGSVGWLVAVTVGFFVAERFVVHLRLGREAYAFSMMEIPLVMGLFFVRPDLLLAARLVGGGLAFLSQRKPPRKMAFNCALFVLETSAAVAVWNAAVGGGDPLSPRGWGATMLAVLVTGLISSTLVSGAIAIATGELPKSLDEVFSLGQLGDLANACFALIGVYLLSEDWRAAWLLAVVVVVLAGAYRAYEGARLRSESLEQVNHFTETVGRDVDVEAVVESVLREVAAAFEVATVELRLSRPFHADQDWTFRDDVVERGTSSLVDPLQALAEGGALRVPRSTRVPEHAALLAEQGIRDCLMVPLRSVGQVAGCLVVADRVSDVATFTPADASQLQSLANHAAVALENACRAELIIRQAEEREHEAMHDELTGLANRRLFVRLVGQALREGRASLLLLDLDRFREVNDTLGHETGDRLLEVVADRVCAATPPGAHVARIAGDEFGVLLPGAGDLDASACATLVREMLAQPIVLNGLSVGVDASVGVVVGEPGGDAVTMLRCADLAMWSAKHNRVGMEVYHPGMDRQDSSRLGLLADLRDAVASNGLKVFYQPKVDLRTGKVTGVEALARWEHPELGPIPPDEFIPLAEHSTLISPLTMLVLRTALADGERWKATHRHFSVAVNISTRSLLDPGFVDEVARALALVEIPASSLTLEITETSLMVDPERAIAALHRLRAVGVRLSVDDLGTGYSSLAYLQRLPVDEVKIDRSFLAQFADPSARAVVGAVVELGHRLGNEVVAEGVEDEEAFEVLRELGCDHAQGYWVARPMPADQLTRFLDNRTTPPVPSSLRLVK